MSSGVDSSAVFSARALAIGISSAVVQLFVDASMDTMSKFAFGCSFQPHSPDESPLTEMFRTVLTRAPTISETAQLRRLWYESHACMIQEMRGRIERTDSDSPKKMAPAERASRLQLQQARLQGLVIAGDLEPSFGLLDRVCQQFDQDQLSYISPEECGSRGQEILGVKKDASLRLERDQQGVVKAKEEQTSEWTDVASDYKLRQAFTRRSLAYDQATLIDFATQEAWVSHLFKLLHKDVPPGYAIISINQILKADREMFIRMADQCRATILPRMGGVKPLDESMQSLMHDPDVAYLVLPLPISNVGNKTKGKGKGAGNDAPYSSGDQRRKSRGKGGGEKKGKGKGDKGGKPDGCTARLEDGRNVCFGYNSYRGCKHPNVAAGGRCRAGFHICGTKGCHQNHSMTACTFRASS